MSYSVVTLGGTVVESGLTKKAAESARQSRCDAENAPYYYHVKEDAEAKAAEAAPTPAEIIGSMPVAEVKTDTVLNGMLEDMTPAEAGEAEKMYDDLQNEGYSDGYNPYRR